ncbi:hypothetical protein ACQKLP_10695 [Chitinophaga sp. NPDC101104]|uniref:hypothetical protein n=1 Tax=Chitinophaga sp. NPDC101104 TaxID=3390561 RepID=UPI003CFF7459
MKSQATNPSKYFRFIPILAMSVFLLITKDSRAQIQYNPNIDTFSCSYTPEIVNQIVNQFELKYPYYVTAYAICAALDSFHIYVHVYASPQTLSDSTEILYQHALENTRRLSEDNYFSKHVYFLQFIFHNAMGGMGGERFSWVFRLSDQKLLDSYYKPFRGPQINAPTFWKRAKDFQLSENEVIHLLGDSCLYIIRFVKDSVEFPPDCLDIWDSKETFRVLYELVGQETSHFKFICEAYVDRKMNYKYMKALNLSQHKLVENPNIYLSIYRLFFPYGVPYCGNCE